MNFLHSILAFILALGLLVAIHEFGHFWVAKRLGVKILRYSLGFGNTLWMRRFGADQTEFVIGAIPLGGYVKMLDEREGEVAAHELDRAFNRQPLKTRFAIVAAGPIANFLFAILAYWIMFMVGVSGLKPILGEVLPDSIAERAGLHSQQEIIAVDGQPTPTWTTVMQATISKIMDTKQVTFTVTGDLQPEETISLDLSAIQVDDIAAGGLLDKIGLAPSRPHVPPIIGDIIDGGEADKSELKSGDLVVTIDDEDIHSWQDLVAYVQSHPSQLMRVTIDRDGQTQHLELTPEAHDAEGKIVGRIGVAAAPLKDVDEFMAIEKYSPIAALGKAANKTWEISALTLRILGKMLTGEASVKNLSGPISIAQYASESASIGITAFLSFLALVSISLGVLNLLPIPVLDGGHLFYYLIEMVQRKPVSEAVQLMGQQIGMLILALLMSVAFYNDLMRVFS